MQHTSWAINHTGRDNRETYLQSHWARNHTGRNNKEVCLQLNIEDFSNLKKLCLNLPPKLTALMSGDKETVLDNKHGVPKDVVVTFCGATLDIVSELTAAWPDHKNGQLGL